MYNNRIKAIDLFHGAGGSSIGASLAGIDIIAGIDKWHTSTEIYKRNFPSAKVINGDIFNLSPKDLRREIGDIDLLLASPECTNHSCAKGAKPRCEKSKETAFQVIKYAKEFRPQWIVIENVIQMKSWIGYKKLLEDLWSLNYFIKEQVLNSYDFGVPQTRRRLFLICSLSHETKQLKKSEATSLTAQSIIQFDGSYKFSQLYSKKRAKATLERAERAFNVLGDKTPFLIVYYGTDGSGGWQPIDRPLRTITTVDRFALVLPSKDGHIMRMLQPIELKKAMGFPDSYDLSVGTRREKIKLLGNAVCPPVMHDIIKSLIA